MTNKHESGVGEVRTGLDNLESADHLLRGRRIGLLTNPTGISRQFQAAVDLLHEHYDLRALFAPEHGIRGDHQAGKELADELDQKTGLPVFSLYGDHKAPTDQELAGLDCMVVDIQDVGARFYTYLYSMAYVMESCARNQLPVIVLDRPNPLGGLVTEGPVLQPYCSSFVGLYPVPVRYGLTIGEFARFVNASQSWGCDLHVVPLAGWQRPFYFDQTGLPWIFPSPNIPTPESALVYAGTCIFEGTNLSEGRGTTRPFELIGAPWLDHDQVMSGLTVQYLQGAVLRPCWFSPTFSKHAGDLCAGFQIHVLDRDQFRPFAAAVALLDAVRRTHADFSFRAPEKPDAAWFIDLLSGSDGLRQPGFELDQYLAAAAESSRVFAAESRQFWLYPHH